MPQRPPQFPAVASGAFVLAATAGFVNAVTVLSPARLTASHVTGSVTRLVTTTIERSPGASTQLLLLTVAAFVAGAAVSGAVLDSTGAAIGRRYGLLLMIEGALLGVAAALLGQGRAHGVALAASAAGLQNALATHYSNAIVRTTHVTGIVTDLGLALGKWLARRGVAGWRVILYASILTGFAGGSLLGTLAWEQWASAALYAPAALTGTAGAAYAIMRQLGVFGAPPPGGELDTGPSPRS